MLSVWRKPVELYIGSTMLLLSDKSICKHLPRSATQPLGEALNLLSQSVTQLKLGTGRRAHVYLSAALWPALANGNGCHLPANTLRSIEAWLLSLGLLPEWIAPMWSVATELALTQCSTEQHCLFMEPDAVTSLALGFKGAPAAHTLDSLDLTPRNSPHNSDHPSTSLRLEFLPEPTPECLAHRAWNKHWRLM